MPEIPEEAIQAAIDGVDHEYVERCGLDHNVARATLTAAVPILYEQFRRDAALALRTVAESRELRHRFTDRHQVLHEGVTVSSALLAVADEIEGDARAPR